MITFLLLLGAIMLVGGAVTAYAMRHAKEGFEDASGFHFDHPQPDDHQLGQARTSQNDLPAESGLSGMLGSH